MFKDQEDLIEAVEFVHESLAGLYLHTQEWLTSKRDKFVTPKTQDQIDRSAIELLLRAFTFTLVRLHKMAKFTPKESIQHFVDAYNQYEQSECSNPQCPIHGSPGTDLPASAPQDRPN